MRPDGQLNLKNTAPGKPGADEEVTQIVFAAVVLVKWRLSQIFVQQQKGVEGHSALDFLCSMLLGGGTEVGRVDALYLKVVAQRRMQQLLVNGADEAELLQEARKQGWRSLYADAVAKVLQGATTVEELWRVGITGEADYA